MHFSNKPDSKKILIISPSFFPSIFGGISVSLHHLVLELSPHFSCSVITTNFKTYESDKIELNKWVYKENFKIIYTNSKNFVYFFQIIWLFYKSIRKNDVIYINSLFFAPNIFLAFIAKMYNKKILWSIHGELSNPALKIGFYKKKIFLFFYKIQFSKYITFLATSYFEEYQIKMKLNTKNVLVIPHIFNLKRVEIIKKKQQFVFLGRISPIKKIENLIYSYSNLLNIKNGNFHYKLLIVGGYDNKDAEYYNFLIDLVKKQNLETHIFFIPEVNTPAKETILAESKFLFLVSDSENFGNVVVESLYQGTPVVASYGTPWEVLTENNCGFWIDNEVESIQETIIKIIDINENEYISMSNNAKILAKQFSSENILQKWLTLINQN